MRKLSTILAFLLHSALLLASHNAFSKITCRDDPNFKTEEWNKRINDKNPNNGLVTAQCHWTDDQGNTRILFIQRLDNKTKNMLVMTTTPDNKTQTDLLVEGGGPNCCRLSHVSEAPESNRDTSPYIFKFSLKDGKRMKMPVNTKADWPAGQQWEEFVDKENVDTDRKLLTLKSHDGIDFYSYYYEPTVSLKNCDGSTMKTKKKKVIVLLQGGTSSYMYEPVESRKMSVTTANYLRSQGYTVLLANFRGKKHQSHDFRLTGIGTKYSNGTRDIITALEALSSQYDIDKSDIKVMGCSRGAQMAALFATNLSRYSTDYKITKTVVSSSTHLNYELSTLNFHAKLPDNFLTMPAPEALEHLYFSDVDWNGGAACPKRPRGVYTDAEWKRILELDQLKVTRYLERYPHLLKIFPSLKNKTCRPDVYKNNSAISHIANLQGDLLFEGGHAEEAKWSGLNFQSKDESERVRTVIHPFGHCYLDSSTASTQEGKNLINQFEQGIRSQFLNGCQKDVTTDDISKMRTRMSELANCLIKIKNEGQGFPVEGVSNLITPTELDTILTRFEKDFLNCNSKPNSKSCRWQIYQSYKSFHEWYKYLAEINQITVSNGANGNVCMT